MQIESKFNEIITDKKKKIIWRESVFLITINTNKSFNSVNLTSLEKMQDIKTCFENMNHKLFSENNIMKLLVRVEGRGSERKQFDIDRDLIKSIKAQTSIEANLKMRGFLHSHTSINVIHKNKVQINLQLLKRVIYKSLEDCLTIDGEYKKPYVNVKATSTNYELTHYTDSQN